MRDEKKVQSIEKPLTPILFICQFTIDSLSFPLLVKKQLNGFEPLELREEDQIEMQHVFQLPNKRGEYSEMLDKLKLWGCL